MFKLEIKTANAAFDEYPHEEVARLLETAAKDLKDNYSHGVLRDFSGNIVGEWSLNAED
jgi:hypothetical protein